MTIHVFEGEKASWTHENQMLQQFLGQLEGRWAQSADWIYVIANAMWEGKELDLVCILPSMIFVGDFKDYKGLVTGAENGPWFADGVAVRGGAQSNPYAQLRKNRFSVMDWLNARVDLDGRNLGHIAAGVIFSGPIKDELDISVPSRKWFHVTDLAGCASTLDTLASPQLELQKGEAEQIVAALGVTEYRWQSSRLEIREIGGNTDESARPRLTEHQQDVMLAIRRFIESGEQQSLAVSGMTCTGKTRLLVEAAGEVANLGRDPIALMPNSRLARLAKHGLEIDCDSIYHHLYLSGADSKASEEDAHAPAKMEKKKSEPVQPEEEEPSADKPQKKKSSATVIPLRKCEDPEDCVYLIDEAQLLGNDLFRTADGKQYGSGQLLSDLFEFSDITKSKRKIIFFGDPYQLQRASQVDRVLDGSFQAARSISHLNVLLEQQILVNQGNARLRNARKLVEALRAGKLASLEFEEDADFQIIDSERASQELLRCFEHKPFSTWYLTDTHAKVERFVRWLRRRLFNKEQPQSLEPGELLELVSVFHPPSDQPLDKQSIKGGYRYRLIDAAAVKQENQQLTGRPEPIRFRIVPSLGLVGPGVSSSSGSETVGDLLLDYLVNQKPEVSPDVAIAVRVWARRHMSLGSSANRAEELPDEDVGLPGVTLGRYGYGATVHHAQGMLQPLCYVNGDTEQGRHSEGYFRWLYTALTVASDTLVLFNFQPMHPFDSMDWNPRSAQKSADIPVGAGWSFNPDAPISARDQQRDVPYGLSESRNLKTSVALWLRLFSAAERCGWQITKATCSPYREKYELAGPGGTTSLVVTYDGKHRVKVLRMEEDQWALLCNIASGCLANNDFTKDARDMLQALEQRVRKTDWRVVSVTETDWRLLVSLVRGVQERVLLEINYNKEGLATSVRPLKYTQAGLLEAVQEALA